MSDLLCVVVCLWKKIATTNKWTARYENEKERELLLLKQRRTKRNSRDFQFEVIQRLRIVSHIITTWVTASTGNWYWFDEPLFISRCFWLSRVLIRICFKILWFWFFHRKYVSITNLSWVPAHATFFLIAALFWIRHPIWIKTEIPLLVGWILFCSFAHANTFFTLQTEVSLLLRSLGEWLLLNESHRVLNSRRSR